MEDFKKLVKEKKVSFGADKAIKSLKLGKAAKVFVTSNCPDSTRTSIKRYAELSGAEVVELDVPNDELGVLCKKPFSVSVLAVLKE